MNHFAKYANRPLWRWVPSVIAMLLLAFLAHHFDHAKAGAVMALNAFEVVDWVMQDSLDLLVNKLGLASQMNTEVQKEFEHDFAPGETVRVKYPQEYLIRNGLEYTGQPLNRRHTTVSLTEIFGIDFDYDSFEKAVKMERGKDALRREYLDPAMAQMAQEIENRAAQYMYQNTSAIVGTLGTDPTSFDTSSAAARQKLVELGCPAGKDRGIFVTPSIMRALKNGNATAFNPQIDVTKMMRTGIVGYGDGFDWYESVSLYQHTAGTWAGAVTCNGAVADGATSILVNCTNGDTVKKGDKFSIANVNPVNPRTRRKVGASARTWSAAADVTASAATMTIPITSTIYGPGSQYQNVDALPINGAALTLFPGTASPSGKVGTVNMAVHPDAFALVGVEFENPKEGSVEISRQLRDEETGLTISFVRWFDGRSRRMLNRFDTCLGFGNLWSDACAVGVLGA
jgi:hypothetical protein